MSWWNPLSWLASSRVRVIDTRAFSRQKADRDLIDAEAQAALGPREAQQVRRDATLVQVLDQLQHERKKLEQESELLKSQLHAAALEQIDLLKQDSALLEQERNDLQKRLAVAMDAVRLRSRSKQDRRNLGYLSLAPDEKLPAGWDLHQVPWESSCVEISTAVYACRVCGSSWLSDYLARSCHSTSWPCQEDGCSERARRPYTACSACRRKKADERYEKKPKKKWDSEGYVYSEELDQFFTEYELYDYLDESVGGEPPLPCAQLRLFLCKTDPPREFSFYEHCEDRVGEGDWCEDRFSDFCRESEEAALIEKLVNNFLKNDLDQFYGCVPDYDSPVLLGENGLPA